jgi:SAM-dependent methyltransferase
MLSRYGKVSAVEMDETARSIAMEKTGGSIDIRLGSFPEDRPFIEEKFDLICLFDVLEHIEEDMATLVALKGLLAKGGRVLITVPAYGWLWGVHDEFLHHKRRYSEMELRHKIGMAGLHTRKLTYFNTILFPLVALIRLKDRFSVRQTSSGTKIPCTPVNSFLTKLFGSERFFLRHFGFLFGVSLLAVLETKS